MKRAKALRPYAKKQQIYCPCRAQKRNDFIYLGWDKLGFQPENKVLNFYRILCYNSKYVAKFAD